MTGGVSDLIMVRRQIASMATIPVYLMVLLFVIGFTVPSQAQVAVERSKDKVVIGGESYYIHIIKKGETSYSISRAYGITVDQLVHENPSAAVTLKEGMSLRIPVRLVSVTPPTQPVPFRHSVHDEGRFIYHILKQGETIYLLSKTYGVSEQDLIQSNPGLDVTRITLGSEIAVPRKAEAVHERNIPDKSLKEYYHKVARGETLSSIARHYDIKLRDLKKANHDIRFPKVGDYIKIPGMQMEEKETVNPVIIDTLPEIVDNQNIYFEKPTEYARINNLKGSIDLAVLLPFYLTENVRRTEIDSVKILKRRKDYRNISRSEDWIYPASIEFVEMYEGILMAADTLRSLGLNINIHAFDIKSDTVEITRLIESGALDKMDLIIGPVYSKNLSLVASYTRDLEIPVVSPVPLFSNSPLDNNPFLFMAGSSLEVAQRAIARKACDYIDHNFVIIHSVNPDQNIDINWFKDLIKSELSKKVPADEIRIKDLVFYSRSEYGPDSLNRLAKALSENKGNVVIIASEDTPVMSETIMEVRNLSRRYDIKVFGYPEMRDLSNIDPKFFFDLGLMIYTPFWLDYSNKDVIRFNSDFRKKFFTEPSEQSYAWQGYDISYYFLSGIAIHGKDFILHPEIHYPDLLHTEFDFRRKSSTDGFENQKLFLIRYTNNYDLESVKDTEAEQSEILNN